MIDKQQFSCRDKALKKFSKLMVNLSSLYFYDFLAFFSSQVICYLKSLLMISLAKYILVF